jgi:hypothetical protein
VCCRGRSGAPLDEAVLADPSYLDTSRYAMQIEQHLEWFAANGCW